MAYGEQYKMDLTRYIKRKHRQQNTESRDYSEDKAHKNATNKKMQGAVAKNMMTMMTFSNWLPDYVLIDF